MLKCFTHALVNWTVEGFYVFCFFLFFFNKVLHCETQWNSVLNLELTKTKLLKYESYENVCELRNRALKMYVKVKME